MSVNVFAYPFGRNLPSDAVEISAPETCDVEVESTATIQLT
jgi:hypothetical protein